MDDFAAAYPPQDIGRAENARQFVAFLTALWERSPPSRAFLPDVMRIEYAMTMARGHFEGDTAANRPASRPSVRLSRHAQSLRCSFDVRALFSSAPEVARPSAGDVRLVVLPPEAGEPNKIETPRIIQISSALHDALLALDEWQPSGSVDLLETGLPKGVLEELIANRVLEVVN